jgi:hypothetical protein
MRGRFESGSKSRPLSERGLDLYETPPVALKALLAVEGLPRRIWEPAAGRGAIVEVLASRGYDVVASDIADYGYNLDFRRDFLATRVAPVNCGCIVTNPPFSLATEFVEHGLNLCQRVVVLGRLAFLESERRSSIMDTGMLARLYVFKNRIPMMHADGWTGPRIRNSAVPYAWYSFDRDHDGPTTVHRIEARRFGVGRRR